MSGWPQSAMATTRWAPSDKRPLRRASGRSRACWSNGSWHWAWLAASGSVADRCERRCRHVPAAGRAPADRRDQGGQREPRADRPDLPRPATRRRGPRRRRRVDPAGPGAWVATASSRSRPTRFPASSSPCAPPPTPATGRPPGASTTAGCRCSWPTSGAARTRSRSRLRCVLMGLLASDMVRAPLLPLEADGCGGDDRDAAAARAGRGGRWPDHGHPDGPPDSDPGGGGMSALMIPTDARSRPLVRGDRPGDRPGRPRGRPAPGGRARLRRPPTAGGSGRMSRPRSWPASPTGRWSIGRPARSSSATGPRSRRVTTSHGGPWRIVPGGTAVRRGAHLGDGVVVMPPSYVNVGAWVGAGDDGRLPRAGRVVRPDRGAGPSRGRRDHRRRARAARRPAGHRRGRRVRRGGLRPARWRARRARRGHRRGGHADRHVARVRPRPRAASCKGRPRRRWSCRRAPSSFPAPRTLAGAFAADHGLAVSVALLVKDRDAGTDARVALEGALR